MTNPYQPPPQSDPNAGHQHGDGPVIDGPIRFAGGWIAVSAIGVFLGAAVMSIYYVLDVKPSIMPNPFATIGVFWFVALASVCGMLRGTSIDAVGRFVIVICALPLAYVLYIPACSFGAMALNGGSYQTEAGGAIFASVVTFTGTLLSLAVAIRRYASRRELRIEQTRVENADVELDILDPIDNQ